MIYTITKPQEFDLAAAAAVAGDVIEQKCPAVTRGAWGLPGDITFRRGLTWRTNGFPLDLVDPVIQWTGHPESIRPDRDVAVVRAEGDLRIEGQATIRCNEAQWRQGQRSEWLYISAALHSIAGRVIATDGITIEGLRGTKAGAGTRNPHVESFGVLVNGDDGGTWIRNLRVTNCPTAADIGEDPYISGCVIGHGASGKAVAESIVQDAFVDVPGAWMAFSANRNVRFRDCGGNGPQMAFHFDTAHVRDVTVEGGAWTGIAQAVSIVTTDDSIKERIVFRDVDWGGGSPTHVISVWDQKATGAARAPIGPVLFDICTWKSSPTAKPAIALVGEDIRPVVFVDCQLPAQLDTARTEQTGNLRNLVIL